MAWTKTAPSLPNGSSWVKVGTTTYQNNNLTITSVVYCARLNGQGFALKVNETRSHYRYNFTDLYLRCDIGGVTGTPETGIKGTKGNGSTTAYFTGEAAAGVQIKVTVSLNDSNYDTRDRFTFTAPALLIVTLNISFDSQNGTACTAIERNQNDPYGELPVSYRRGHKFLGWSTDTTSANIVSSSTVITQSAKFTLYAIWKFIGSLYIKINGAWQSIY